jgi:hypothetical protein
MLCPTFSLRQTARTHDSTMQVRLTRFAEPVLSPQALMEHQGSGKHGNAIVLRKAFVYEAETTVVGNIGYNACS